MRMTKLAISLLLAGIGTGCTGVPPAPFLSISELPNCFDTNYDRERGLFMIKTDIGNAVNQQCLLTVGPSADAASASRLRAGSYRAYFSNGGGGGAGGSVQGFHSGGGGGGGGGGAGAAETQAIVYLTEGLYRLTIGAGGPGGSACIPTAGLGGGPGWIGSPSNMIRVATGELVIGTPGAERYVRPTRGQTDKAAGKMDAHGGSGPGQASGGHGNLPETKDTVESKAQPGAGKLASGRSAVGGASGVDTAGDKRSGGGGGGGATSVGRGGAGGGESPGQKEIPPQRGSLGSGGGGGEGSAHECDPGARGGHGYIALRPI